MLWSRRDGLTDLAHTPCAWVRRVYSVHYVVLGSFRRQPPARKTCQTGLRAASVLPINTAGSMIPRENSEMAQGGPKLPSEAVQALLSVALFIHLFCVFVSLSSNWIRSPVQRRLLVILRPYTQLLNIDLNFTPYHLTHGRRYEVDNCIEVDIEDEQGGKTTMRLPPDDSMRAGKAYARYKALANIMAFFAIMEEENGVSHVAQSVAAHAFAAHLATNAPADDVAIRGEIRSQQHNLQTTEALRNGVPGQADPNDASFFGTSYVADIHVDRTSGEVRIHKRTGRGEAAPVGNPESE